MRAGWIGQMVLSLVVVTILLFNDGAKVELATSLGWLVGGGAFLAAIQHGLTLPYLMLGRRNRLYDRRIRDLMRVDYHNTESEE
jgi:hypothetical protein